MLKVDIQNGPDRKNEVETVSQAKGGPPVRRTPAPRGILVSRILPTRLSLNAPSITPSSTARFSILAIASTSWPAWRSAKITGPAQLSSARNFTLQGLVTTGPSESSTTSSWATLAAP